MKLYTHKTWIDWDLSFQRDLVIDITAKPANNAKAKDCRNSITVEILAAVKSRQFIQDIHPPNQK
ncbi:hypothetical protein A9Q94_10500 [Rhodobacterales bacterium 56_14_T64]|nr:hypothetical protein A9Q94_10500 [Rhodobacterales bacterium 56_14_T64]